MTKNNVFDYKKMVGKTMHVADARSLPYEELARAGVQRILFDYDGTLSERARDLPSKDTIQFLHELQDTFDVMIFSNNWWKARKRIVFCEEHGLVYVRTRKPFYFEKKYLSDGARAVIVGDKRLTDGLYAKRLRIPFFFVQNSL